MNASSPHFLLFSESSRTDARGQWRFVLQSLDGGEALEAADTEPNAKGERLELLAVVRGLEALPQPSRVTLVTPSQYVNRGLSYGLADWRANDWQWEHFGEMAPVKNRDLWKRIDRALEFHSVDCRLWRFDSEEKSGGQHGVRSQMGHGRGASQLAGPHFLKNRSKAAASPAVVATSGPAGIADVARPPANPDEVKDIPWDSRVKSWEFPGNRRYLGCQARRRWIRLLGKLERMSETVWLRLGQLGTRLIPPPWMC